jgi:hypothetical protein
MEYGVEVIQDVTSWSNGTVKVEADSENEALAKVRAMSQTDLMKIVEWDTVINEIADAGAIVPSGGFVHLT